MAKKIDGVLTGTGGAPDPVRRPFDVVCPVCAALVSMRCRTVTSGRVTDTHQARHDMSAELAADRRLERVAARRARRNDG